jgi:hypothetical protein
MTAVTSTLANQGFLIPRDASVFCMNRETWFPWHSPLIDHLYGDETPMVKRIVRWVNQAARGKADRDYVSFPLEFVPGESMAHPPRSVESSSHPQARRSIHQPDLTNRR